MSTNWLVMDLRDDTSTEDGFWLDDQSLLFEYPLSNHAAHLAGLTYKVGRNPKDLLAHLRRIYYCYRHQLGEPLYASLLDLMVVLQAKGRQLRQRLVSGCRARLDPGRYDLFLGAIDNPERLPASRYCLFTTGLIGCTALVQINDRAQAVAQIDFLDLANDYIEYSQLEEAMDILETGLATQPRRRDLQVALLELYKSTDNRARYQLQSGRFRDSGEPLTEEWQALGIYFDGKPL